MIGAIRLQIDAGATVTVSSEHQDCACVGVAVTMPDGSRLVLDAADPDVLEALGLEIASAAEAANRARAIPMLAGGH